MLFRRTCLTVLAAVSALSATGQALAQAFPSKPVKIVVPYPAGGPTDTLARALGQKLAEAWGKSVVVDNKPGGGGQIGAQVLKQAEADGHTLFLGATEMFAINQSLYKNFAYDPLVDLKMVAPLMSIPMLLVVPKDSPANSVDELVALSRQKPQGLSFASQGIGSIGHMLGLQFMQKTGAKLTHVPYKGSAPALQEMVAGQPDMMFDVPASAGPFVAGGKLKALAIAAPARGASLPQVRTLAESGHPGLDASVWMALAAKAGTPDAVVRQIQEQVAKALQSPDVIKRFTDTGWSPIAMNPAQFDGFVRGEVARWSALIKSSGATAE